MRPVRWSYTHPRTLRAQGDVPHTFGTLLIPLALLLVAGGGYQLERNIARPLESDAATILFGSVTLACGLLLGLYLLRSLRTTATPSQSSEQASSQESALVQSMPAPPKKSLARETPPPQPFHRYYVDEARISR